MKRLNITDSPLQGLKIVERTGLSDARGRFSRLFCIDEMQYAGVNFVVAQINHSCTALAGTIRGLHFQYPPSAEKKLVSCIRGEIFDVAVDLRQDSPTFLKYYSIILSAENNTSLLIPEGFAHGFQTLTNDVELIYLHSAAFDVNNEGGINANDPALAIKWPQEEMIISERDRMHPMIGSDFRGLNIK